VHGERQAQLAPTPSHRVSPTRGQLIGPRGDSPCGHRVRGVPGSGGASLVFRGLAGGGCRGNLENRGAWWAQPGVSEWGRARGRQVLWVFGMCSAPARPESGFIWTPCCLFAGFGGVIS